MNYLSFAILLYILTMQIHNFVKYRLKNGANRKRIILMTSCICLIIHVVKLMLGHSSGFFLFMSILIGSFLYDDFIIETLLQKIFKK